MKIYSAHGINEFIVCLRLQGLHDQGIFRQLLPAHVRRHVRHARTTAWTCIEQQPSRGASRWSTPARRRMTGRPPASASRPISRRRGLLLHLWRRRRRHRHRRAGRLPPRAGRLATVTAVQPPGRFGALDLDGDGSRGFQEKPAGDGGWINGGFFVLSPKVIDLHRGRPTRSGSASRWSGLARDGQLAAYPAPRLLAADGHAARQERCSKALWSGAAPGDVEGDDPPTISGAGKRGSS